jgi:hypothetical protein
MDVQAQRRPILPGAEVVWSLKWHTSSCEQPLCARAHIADDSSLVSYANSSPKSALFLPNAGAVSQAVGVEKTCHEAS